MYMVLMGFVWVKPVAGDIKRIRKEPSILKGGYMKYNLG